MRALVQRVSEASVSVGQELVSSIGNGLLIFLGVCSTDSDFEAEYISDKLLNLRIFSDSRGKFDKSALDESADILVVSQFTLYSDTRKGRRPSFTQAAHPDQASELIDKVVDILSKSGLNVQIGRFQAHMSVSIVNDGPVTIMIDTDDKHRSRRN
ncbi:MAG: D-aminoacyl-tRNA deacylase [Chloroflexota bacterium]|nr:D-aminoacyl-tRNA deacylase [Chloroflexota bacterium]